MSTKIFVMINKDGGGGAIFRFYGGHSCYEGGHRAHGGSVPPTRENPVLSYQVNKAFCCTNGLYEMKN